MMITAVKSACSQTRAVDFSGVVIFFISPAHLHVLKARMGRTCRWAGGFELPAIGVKLNTRIRDAYHRGEGAGAEHDLARPV